MGSEEINLKREGGAIVVFAFNKRSLFLNDMLIWRWNYMFAICLSRNYIVTNECMLQFTKFRENSSAFRGRGILIKRLKYLAKLFPLYNLLLWLKTIFQYRTCFKYMMFHLLKVNDMCEYQISWMHNCSSYIRYSIKNCHSSNGTVHINAFTNENKVNNNSVICGNTFFLMTINWK